MKRDDVRDGLTAKACGAPASASQDFGQGQNELNQKVADDSGKEAPMASTDSAREEQKAWPTESTGCGYTGYDFGASYPDSICIDGVLYDLDRCDERGNLYEPPHYIPCPECQHEAWLEMQRENIEEQGGIAAEDGESRESCPFPAKATRYPQDGEWYQRHWLNGWDSRQAPSDHSGNEKSLAAPGSPKSASSSYLGANK